MWWNELIDVSVFFSLIPLLSATSDLACWYQIIIFVWMYLISVAYMSIMHTPRFALIDPGTVDHLFSRFELLLQDGVCFLKI